jgi:outer membrane biosynthesis protein TonB
MKARILACLVALLPGCAARARPPAVPAVPPPSADAREGHTSVRVLDSPEARRPRGESRVTVVAAEAGPENKLPEYPPAALRAGCGGGVVAVRIHVGPNGRVLRQGAVPGRSLAAGPCQDEFAAAVRSTVSSWGFFPAMRRVCGDDGTECTDSPITVYLDLEFRFEVVDGRGRVASP